jgi:hypothetical protein
MVILSVVCPTKAAAQQARAVLIQYGVDMTQVQEYEPLESDPPDTNIYLLINYALSQHLSEQQIAQLDAELRRRGSTTT